MLTSPMIIDERRNPGVLTGRKGQLASRTTNKDFNLQVLVARVPPATSFPDSCPDSTTHAHLYLFSSLSLLYIIRRRYKMITGGRATTPHLSLAPPGDN